MADKKLAKSVYVAGRWYKAGESVPEDVAAKIRNSRVFATAEDAEPEPAADPGAPDGRRLATRVHVDGRWYGPHDAIPDEVAAKIRNPRAWAAGEPAQQQEQEPAPVGSTASPADQPPVEKTQLVANDDDGEAKPRGRGGRRA